MCGIVGTLNFNSGHKVNEEVLQKMTRVLSHRGPDDEGIYIGPKTKDQRLKTGYSIGLGHRRLSIIDLSPQGHQPMSNEDESIWIVFNGEIYNFLDLRVSLINKGHRFKSSSDTEVLLHLYEDMGEKCLNELRGMFAFAIWDARKNTLLLARDRLGKKPLYYYKDNERIVFASEIKAILEDSSIKRIINNEALDSYLSFLNVPAPMTIFKNIHKLPPAHYMRITTEKTIIKEYWDVYFDNRESQSEDYYIEKLDRLLTDAVKKRLISDVPLGAFLSGGIDSSAIVAIMANTLNQAVITNSIGFNEKSFNELDYARVVSRKFNTNHHEYFVEPKALDILEKLIWHFDEPFADASAVPTYYVSKLARSNVTVSLSGDGGDEIFAGYIRRYFMNLLEDKFRNTLPAFMKKFVTAPIAKVYPKAEWIPRFLRAKFFLTNVSITPEEAYFRDMSMFLPEQKRLLYSSEFLRSLNGFSPYNHFSEYYKKAPAVDHLSKIQYVDIKTYLPNDILVKVDRMSMANSLEVRSPLLDHKFIEFVATIPSNLKLKNRVSKYIFKKLLERKLPQKIIYRNKQGFAVPLASWFRNELKGFTQETLFSERAQKRGYFDYKVVRKMWDEHLKGTQDFSDHLWVLLVLESWHQIFMD